MLGRKVLIDGASGGVGHPACQLALAAGAIVHGHVRNASFRDMVAEWCGDRTIVAPDLVAAASFGPFHLILDSVGGSALGAALGMLRPDGTCVTFGVSEASTATFDRGHSAIGYGEPSSREWWKALCGASPTSWSSEP